MRAKGYANLKGDQQHNASGRFLKQDRAAETPHSPLINGQDGSRTNSKITDGDSIFKTRRSVNNKSFDFQATNLKRQQALVTAASQIN